MTDVIYSIRPYLEALYFLSGIVLAAGLFLTFRQLSISANDSDIRSKRAAEEKAIEACSRYSKDAVELDRKYSELLESAKIPTSYRGRIGDFSAQSLSRLKNNPRLDPSRTEILKAVLVALNEYHMIAAYFVSGIACEKTGFNIIGRSFCRTVERNYDYISVARSDPAVQYWSHIVTLYKMWRPRITEAELTATADIIQQQLSEIQKSPNK